MNSMLHRPSLLPSLMVLSLLPMIAVSSRGEEAANRSDSAPPAVQPGVSVPVPDGPGWTVRFRLKDYLQEYVFPEELISYRITCPPNTIRKENLRLVREGDATPLPYQLSDVKEANGFLQGATISFRTNLKKGEEKNFTLTCDPAYKLDFAGGVAVRDIDAAAHTAVIAANTQQVRVPYGEYFPNAPLKSVAAPILEISRTPGTWIGHGSFTGDAVVEKISTSVIEGGPLRLRYRIDYALAGGKQYSVVLTVQHNEAYVTVDEYLKGIDVADDLGLRFSYSKGIDPDGRIAMANNGDYLLRSGRYDAGLKDGLLPYTLGIFGPNVACPRTTLFYKDTEEKSDAIAFSLYRLKDWKTHVRYTWWFAASAEEAFYFHSDGDKYMSTALAGTERHWALSIIPRSEVAIQSQDGSRRDYWYANSELKGLTDKNRGGDPSARLFQKLGAYSLDWFKDLIFEFDEDVNAVYDGHSEPLTYKEFNSQGKAGSMWDGMFWWGGADWAWRFLPVERYQDGMCYGAKSPGRTHWQTIAAYAASRKNWTPEERLKVRSWIIHFVATYMLLDDNLPHFSMVGGHPNFLIESLYPGVFAAAFPKHPYNEQFKKIYLDILNEYLDVYVRKAKPEINALGGRHTESIACYSYASLQGVLHNGVGFRQYDGSDILNSPAFLDWIRWHMNALMTAGECKGWEFGNNEFTHTPPQGAHAAGTWKVLYDTAEYLERNHNALGAELKWCLTKGREGKKPAMESALFYDYGPILRYDLGGEHEAYLQMLHLGNADPMPGYKISGLHYRWGGNANGVLCYAARGRTWTWNKCEDCGDRFDITGITAFEVPGTSMGFRKLSAATPLLNLGAVQFFHSAEDAGNDYVSRGVMMVRDRYLAIYDRVKDANVKGIFHWNNRKTGVKVEYFQSTDLTKPVGKCVDAGRFPFWRSANPAVDKTGESVWAKSGLAGFENFSARFTTRLTPGSEENRAGTDWKTTTIAQTLGPNDTARLWLDEKLVMDGKDGAQAAIALEYGREYDLRYEYVHTTGPTRARLRWSNEPGGRVGDISGSNCCTYYRDMPAIHNVRRGPGDQFHLVEPATEGTLSAAAKPYGCTVGNGDRSEYVLMSAAPTQVAEGKLAFTGRTGYAAANELYLFEGAKLALGDFSLEIAGDFAASATVASRGRMEGRLAGRSGGTLTIIVPAAFDPQGKIVTVDGQAVPFSYDAGKRAVKFNLTIALRDGYKCYAVTAKP